MRDDSDSATHYDPDEREQAVAVLARYGFQRVVNQGETPREATRAAAEGDLMDFDPGLVEDATAHVERATLSLLERVADRLDDVDLEDSARDA